MLDSSPTSMETDSSLSIYSLREAKIDGIVGDTFSLFDCEDSSISLDFHAAFDKGVVRIFAMEV